MYVCLLQMEQAHSAGAASSTGSLERALIPCTCSRVDIGDVPDALGDGPALKQRCFEDINECINASTEKRKRVLVHCRDGFSLAPTCIIQYLMVKQNMRLIAAYELLRANSFWETVYALQEVVRTPNCFVQCDTILMQY
uniref:Tyrosine specific protein phosphatases domain-containing protein n=1 Tax=Amphiprion percula TaxID=161767 RepID=A0A3P8TEA1_AMPPE